MTTRFLASAVASLLIAAFSPQLRAETVAYPAADPLFTLEVPDGWAVRNEPDGPLMLQNGDATIVAVFDSRVTGVTDLATATEAVQMQKTKTAKQTGYTDLKVITSVREMQLNEEINGVGGHYSAKLPGGQPVIYIVMIFTPDGARYCSMEFSIKPDGLLPAAEKERDAMLASIKPFAADAADDQ